MTRRLKILLILAGFCAACATTNPVVTRVSNVVDCSTAAVVSQLPAIVSEVATDLLEKDYVKLLTDIARRVGDDALVCAVLLSGESASARLAAVEGEQPNASVIKAHAADYLLLRDVRFAGPSRAAWGPICTPPCVPPLVCRRPVNPPSPGHGGICIP